jgi:hypothetical protein
VDSGSLEVPGLMALASKDLLVVARSMRRREPAAAARAHPSLGHERCSTRSTFLSRVRTPSRPTADYAYVASLGVNQIASVALDSGTVQLVDVDGPQHTLTLFAISPDHRAARRHRIHQRAAARVQFSPTPRTPAFVREVEVEPGPFESAYTADGRHLVVSNLDANAVDFLDTSTWTVEAVVKDSGASSNHMASRSVRWPPGVRVQPLSGGRHPRPRGSRRPRAGATSSPSASLRTRWMR